MVLEHVHELMLQLRTVKNPARWRELTMLGAVLLNEKR